MTFQKKKKRKKKEKKKIGKEKKKKRNVVKVLYLATKVKARNFLNNIFYRRVKKQDFLNFSFIVDIFTYLIKDFNPFFYMVNLIKTLIERW